MPYTITTHDTNPAFPEDGAVVKRTTDLISLPLGDILDVLAPLAVQRGTMTVQDDSGRLVATVHRDGGIDFTSIAWSNFDA